MKTSQTISLLGAGYLGQHFAKSLKLENLHLKLSTTSAEKYDKLQESGYDVYSYKLGDSDEQAFLKSDFIFILIPPSEEALEGLKNLNVKNFIDRKIIYTSSIGIYDSSLKNFPEDFSFDPISKRQELLMQMEKEITKFPHHLILRLGGLIGEERNPVISISKKGSLLDGNTPLNFSHLQDILTLFHMILKNFKPGVFNFVSNGHPLKKNYYTRECQRLNLSIPTIEDSRNPDRIIRASKLEKAYNIELKDRFS